MFHDAFVRRLLPVAFCLSVLFASCDREDRVAGGSDDTHSTVVDIQGRVLTKDARPYGNVIVRLRGLGLLDTTDGEGLFRFRRDSLPLAARAADAVDTIDYQRDGQTILSVPVPTWVSVLPDVMLVQRDLSGSLGGGLEDVARVVCILNLPDGSAQEVELELGEVTRRYSGFAYFRYTGGVDSFAAVVEARDDSGRLLGRSPQVRFTSRAGDIAFPGFDATNAVPSVRLRAETPENPMGWPVSIGENGVVFPVRIVGQPDTLSWRDAVVASRRETVRLHALVTDSLLRMARVEWNFGTGWVRASAPTPLSAEGCPACDWIVPTKPEGPMPFTHWDTLVAVPNDARGTWSVRVRVTDVQGRTTEDTLAIEVVASPPTLLLWSNGLDRLVPGAAMSLALHDSDRYGGHVVSRRLFLGRNLGAGNSGADVLTPSLPSWGSEKDRAESLRQAVAGTAAFRARATSVAVSGADTTLRLPSDSLGAFMLLYEAVDDDGDTSVAMLPFRIRAPAPRIDSLVAGPDSVVVKWSYDLWPAPARGGTWIVTGGWQGVADTFRLEVPGDASRLALPRPLGARDLRLSLRRAFLSEGLPADTLLASLPYPALTFTGAVADSLRLLGAGFGIGERGYGRLTAGAGVGLAGEVARLEWSMGDGANTSGAGAWFPLAIEPGARRFHVEVANRSTVEVVVPVMASSNAEYQDRVLRGCPLRWVIPAGFVGSLDLDLADLRWPSWAQDADTTGIDRSQVLASIDAIQFQVVQFQDSTVRSGVLELDNLGWK